MERGKILKYLITILLLPAIVCCRETIVPKPRGHFRIDFPERNYKTYETSCPFIFEYPVYGRISEEIGKIKEPCWFNIEFPGYRATLHLSYKNLRNNLAEILNESHEFAYAHSIKADAISERPWLDPYNKVFGILYDIKGNTASSVQFYLTDSTKHFLRGALYFTSQPDEDSLAPVINWFRDDIIHLIETLKWK